MRDCVLAAWGRPFKSPSPMRHSSLAGLALVLALVAGTEAAAQVPNDYLTRQVALPCLDKTFGLRVHVSDDFLGGPSNFDTAAFEGLLAYANEAFAPICVGFEACEYLRVENYRYHSYESRELPEQVDVYGDPNRIDIFVTVRDSSGSRCGDADLEGILREPQAGVMVVSACFGQVEKILAQQLGRYFGLRYTNDLQEPDELVDGSNCETAGDHICDTPADPFFPDPRIQWVAEDDPCRFVWRERDANGDFYVPHTGNIMSPYASECACGFTSQQLRVMAGNIRQRLRDVW